MVMRDVAPLHVPRLDVPSNNASETDEASEEDAKGKRLALAAQKKQPRHKRQLTTVASPLFVPPAVPPVRVQHAIQPVEDIGRRSPGVDTYSWRTFTDGRMKVEKRLDLHGMVAEDAFRRLMEFMDVAYRCGLRCVEVVTGLGTGHEGGILRRELPHWLGRADMRHRILGVAYPHAGNKGSVRILLRRRKR
ncbi:methionine ABC transporter substrate-binding protein [Acetobacter orleanensis]|uniref:Smr domain-containing protein n=2 Tax=Acetobacter orleanensis TaxID=104099 RepID=A0A4Y3TLW6_9PROT|nr:methionine ABC transporter substrate-binding protein [Acetobacter orleanensis]PCD80757.1 methionine ABC transporter substrate-binding protein [Acetobacter orleanensis]GAN68080.1 DNA mismatch repair protein Smr/MutS2 [Acetobacter orleanensis JCM 7639]GEB81997.1 hypothetical protein AOR01nite_04740 [Acetobacter orleanensis]